ncbi:MAG TPA: CPBP family intramembrane glutamic endopeptidase [Terriglobales bacterium]|nr:CPBP family intramembrane glutamic endopeptidase [Terriglobales bacterium]
MAVGSKTFPQELPQNSEITRAKPNSGSTSHTAFGINPAAQIAIAYTLLLISLWTSLASHRLWMIFCGAILLILTLVSSYSGRELGLANPSSRGWFRILLIGLGAAAAIVLTAVLWGEKLPANSNWPPPRDLWQYAIWAMVQQFILQSFFYVRLETLLGARSAVIAGALLFAAAHLPSPILTLGTLLAGIFFCEMFRRYRSIYPLGIVHAALGLALAETIPDHWLHHMRVGIGYLHFHLR